MMAELSFLDRETCTTRSIHWFIDHASTRGIIRETALRICERMEAASAYERVIESGKLIPILRDWRGDEAIEQVLTRSSFSFQGTDGVRGVVGTGTEGPLASFIGERILSPGFCSAYIDAFITMLREAGSIGERIVFAEDGRDSWQGGSMKESILASLHSAGIEIIDLGTVPTPYLARYSKEQRMPGIMLTASHNPASYNGIKLFLDGKKLYPEGPCGEYRHTALIFEGQRPQNLQHSVSRTIVTNPTEWILEKLDDRLAASLEDIPRDTVVLDTANGAYSHYALAFLRTRSFRVIEAACSPGRDRINTSCGVAVLEHYRSDISTTESLSPTARQLVSAGRQLAQEYTYGIVLDGDGDRGFLLQYRKEDDSLHLFDGDALGYLIARSLQRESSCPSTCVVTVESDAALKAALEMIPGMQVELSCVGDRWLVVDHPHTDPHFIGIERSGHVIIPHRLDRDHPTCHLSGDGLVTALLGMCELARRDPDDRVPFEGGYRKELTIRNIDLSRFYRGSEQWHEASRIFETLMNLPYQQRTFEREIDMLFYELTDDSGIGIGHWYLRRSGTEPKISCFLSCLKEYENMASRFMAGAEKGLTRLLTDG